MSKLKTALLIKNQIKWLYCCSHFKKGKEGLSSAGRVMEMTMAFCYL